MGSWQWVPMRKERNLGKFEVYYVINYKTYLTKNMVASEW